MKTVAFIGFWCFLFFNLSKITQWLISRTKIRIGLFVSNFQEGTIPWASYPAGDFLVKEKSLVALKDPSIFTTFEVEAP